MDKKELKELKLRISEVLFYFWDPIGVSPDPLTRDEYDNYIDDILKLIYENNESEPIANFLENTSKKYMGIVPDIEKCRDVAEIILEYKKIISRD
jgi:hypothetical protein